MSTLPTPWLEPWPAADLEPVSACPICGAQARSSWLDGLVDNTFRTSPGRWHLWRCGGCKAGYLDPRPSAGSIHRAYSRYYTHGDPSSSKPATLAWRLRRWLFNGYANKRFGVADRPAAALGPWLVGSVPLLRHHADRDFRHLPPLPKLGGALLDIGCGDGEFLARAARCGWRVLGLEPDAQAAGVARRQGVTVVEGGIEALDDRAAAFDVITLAHVIEHVPHPMDTLHACHRLLKPGGTLWIETPNAASLGFRRFGANWRGLEVPRHVVLFTPPTLRAALQAAGFEELRHPASPSVRRWMVQRSLAIRDGRWPESVRRLGPLELSRCWLADLVEGPPAARGEFLTITARRPA